MIQGVGQLQGHPVTGVFFLFLFIYHAHTVNFDGHSYDRGAVGGMAALAP